MVYIFNKLYADAIGAANFSRSAMGRVQGLGTVVGLRLRTLNTSLQELLNTMDTGR